MAAAAGGAPSDGFMNVQLFNEAFKVASLRANGKEVGTGSVDFEESAVFEGIPVPSNGSVVVEVKATVVSRCCSRPPGARLFAYSSHFYAVSK